MVIKSQTNCPTCGVECKVGGFGQTHYYLPLKEYTEKDVQKAISFGFYLNKLDTEENLLKKQKDFVISLKTQQ